MYIVSHLEGTKKAIAKKSFGIQWVLTLFGIPSSPVVGTNFAKENEDYAITCTEFAQNKPRHPDRRVKFPVTIEFYDQRAKIYASANNFPFYRVAFKVAGKRRMLTFGTYGEAKKAAEEKVKELHKGQQSSALTAKQAQDALTVLDMITAYRQETGKLVSFVEMTDNYLSAVKQLPKGCSLLEASPRV